jgi:adenylate cyclase
MSQRFNWWLLDTMSQKYRQHAVPSEKVKLILIDDASVHHLASVVGRYPWPRGIYAPIIKYLEQAGVHSIYFDILFSEPEESATSHAEFTQTLGQFNNVNVVGIMTKDDALTTYPTSTLTKAIIPIQHDLDLTPYNNLYLPIPDISKHSTTIPIATIYPALDGRYRHVPLLHQYQDHTLQSMPLAAVHAFAHHSTLSLKHNALQVPPYTIPIDTQARMTLNWYPQGIDKYSFSGVLASWQSLKKGKTPLINPSVFKDTIVIIGASAVGLHDLKSTPIQQHMAGAEIQATAISNILNHELLHLSPNYIALILTLLLTMLVPRYILTHPTIKRYLLTLLVPTTLIIMMVILFRTSNYVLQLGSPLLGFILAFVCAVSVNSITEYLEKQKVKQTFSMYVSPKILQELAQNYKDIKPEMGKEKHVTILFTDIRNFTGLSETHPTKTVITLLNDYFDAMIGIIQDHDGTVDKIIGDAIMAFWNAPIDTPNHALQAVKTSLMMQQELVHLNKQWEADGYPTLATGIGINTGTCIVGNIGSKRRVNYTLIGDPVNATARIEALCKNYDDNILISESTYKEIEHQLPCTFIDKVTVKGKKEALNLYAPR